MKVSQLIKLLSTYPAATEVLVEGYENGYDPVHSLTTKTLAGVVNAADYDGLFDTPDNLEQNTLDENMTGFRSMARRENGTRADCVVILGLRGQRR
ncbi:hypothetical protein P8730_12980 [Pseudomonas aeruginosa]|uniref:hypothetical protein n=1 Tax=Pseudomonas aeruginosa TaxID=287 RepID=UPI0029C9ED78|nr:hypothetical protein [Pseudomonas aeruginosa]WPH10675.1 hypothetical protein P8730_12980 [Pseudomonas aeruginosa]